MDQGDWTQGPGLLSSLWRYRYLIAAVTVVTGLLGFLLASRQPPVYSATARLLLREPQSSVFVEQIRPLDDPTRLPEQVEVLTSRPVMELAAEELGGDATSESVRGQIEVGASDELDIIDVTASSGSAGRAADVANAVAQAYLDSAAEDARERAAAALRVLTESQTEIQARIDKLAPAVEADSGDVRATSDLRVARRQLSALGETAQQIAIDASLEGANAELFAPAVPPEQSSQTKPLTLAVLAALLGLIGASLYAWWRSGKTLAANASEDAAGVLRAPFLGDIPVLRHVKDGQLPDLAQLPPGNLEAYLFVLSSIEFFLGESGGSSVIMTSADQGDGKSLTAVNLSMAAAREGRRVTLVDADERARGLTRQVGVLAERGLTDLGVDSLALHSASVDLRQRSGSEVRFVPVGQRAIDPTGYFRTPEFHRSMAQVKADADLVVVDAPPILAVAETSAIAAQVDGIVLVVTRGTRLRRLEEVRNRLEFVGTPLIGYVFNRSRSGKRDTYTYGYKEPSPRKLASLSRPRSADPVTVPRSK